MDVEASFLRICAICAHLDIEECRVFVLIMGLPLFRGLAITQTNMLLSRPAACMHGSVYTALTNEGNPRYKGVQEEEASSRAAGYLQMPKPYYSAPQAQPKRPQLRTFSQSYA